MSKGYQISRPSWMSRQDYGKCITTWSHGHTVPIQCFHADFAEDCDGYENLTIDHIVPRHHGGTNDTGNLQPLCAKCNRRKYTNDDPYWKQSFALDQIPELENLRAAHIQGVWTPIADTYQEYFSRPINQINQVSYLYAWIVGAGKTLSIPITAMAINYAIRKNVGPAAPRIDRILVLSKSVDLRDQVQTDIAEDLIRYQVVGSPLRTLSITSSDVWANERYIKQYDVVSACIHQVWERNSGRTVRDLQNILSMFPLIVIDEGHWAEDQCQYIVENAVNSIVFTTTGTPIEATGQLLSSLVLVSSWGYRDANIQDNGVKYLSDSHDEFNKFVHVVGIDNAEVVIGGTEQSIEDELVVDGYNKNMIPTLSVMEEVIMELYERDNLTPGLFSKLAPHRKHIEDIAVPDLVYPAHAFISVDSITAANNLSDQINEMLNADRRKYPQKLGWQSVAFHSGEELTKKDKSALEAWRRCYKRNGELDDQCARIIVSVDKIKEGINNPYCCIAGVAKSVNSLIDVVQGPVGRLIRSVTRKDGTLVHVPPEQLDRVRIVTHRTYQNEDILKVGIEFIMNMNSYYKGLIQLEDLIVGLNEYTPRDGDKEPLDNLSESDKMRLAFETGSYVNYASERGLISHPSEISIDPAIIVASALGKQISMNKKDRGIDFVLESISDPSSVYKNLLEPRMAPIAIVVEEHLKDDITDHQLQNFVQRRSELAQFAGRLHEQDIKLLIVMLYREERSKFKVRVPARTEELSKIKSGIVHEISHKHNLPISENKELKSQAHRLAYRAIKEVLGIPQDVTLSDKGNYDTPQVHYILMNPHVRKCIRQLIITDLIRDGFIPELKFILQEQINHEAA